LGFAVERFMGAKHESFEEFLEPWMRPLVSDERARERVNVFSASVIEDVHLAFDLGLLTQDALIALGPQRLRASGAWAKDRITDTTVRG
jgi:hypothetical protein